jgi:hypothetical protein
MMFLTEYFVKSKEIKEKMHPENRYNLQNTKIIASEMQINCHLVGITGVTDLLFEDRGHTDIFEYKTGKRIYDADYGQATL